MRIEIETTGDSGDTKISINGKPQPNLREFHISVHSKKRVKLQMVKDVDGKIEFISYYGDDFKKYDEFNPVENKENCL